MKFKVVIREDLEDGGIMCAFSNPPKIVTEEIAETFGEFYFLVPKNSVAFIC